MRSKSQVMNNLKTSSQESNMGDNSQQRRDKKSGTEIYIGNICAEASKANLLKFFEDVKPTYLRLVSNGNKVFAFANFHDLAEAERAVEMYHNKVFMGHTLVVRLANTVKPNKKPETLPPMPELEDIGDDDYSETASDCDDKSKRIRGPMPQLEDTMPEKNSFEDPMNIQADSSGLFSLCINRKDSYLRSKHVVEKIFCQYGSVSSVSYTDDTIVVKMPSKPEVINVIKALGQELNLTFGHSSVDTNAVKRTQNKRADAASNSSKIYIGNINVKASKEKLIEFLGEVNIISLRMLSKGNKVFAFANFPDESEAEKAVEMYNNQFFMGSKLVIRLADDRNKKPETLPPMPELEDIGDDDYSETASDCDDKSKRIRGPMPQLEDTMPEKNSFNRSNQLHCKGNDKSSNFQRKLSKVDETNLSTDLQNHPTLFVGNFPIGMSEEQLLSLFQDFHASNVNIINNHNPKRSTQALVNFPNQKESEKAIYKFDKTPFKGSTLLVTSVGFCPCYDAQKSDRKNKASSSNHSLPVMDRCNGSNSIDKRLERLEISSSVRQQQRGRNAQPAKKPPYASPLKKMSNKSPRMNSSRNKNMPEYNQQMQEEDQQPQNSQINEPYNAEAAKMTILVKNFSIQPLCSSTDILQVMITSVTSNKLFWGNVFSSSSDSDLRDFMVLHNELQSSALNWPKYILSRKEMKCVALYQGEWYRAWVLNSVEKDVVEVFFLDYGNISQINLNDVRSCGESVWKLLPKARAFKVDRNSEDLPPNAENQFFDIKVCKSGNMANGFISVASLVSH